MARTGKCKNNLNDFDIGPGFPGPSMPGFGTNIALPGLDIPFPEGFPENILDLLNKLRLKWPGGIDLSAIVDQFMKKLSQLISNILTQISAFLAIYNIIMVIIQMIICIIEVLCGLIRKAPKKLKRLFRTCIPLFISIFPFLALLALILAILALILALIEYIISIIKKIWDELRRNFENLKKAVKREQTPGKSASMIAIARKIATILCALENIMLLFLVITSVIEIIKGMLKKSISMPCQDDESGLNCDSDCSDLIIAPENISNQPAIITYSVTMPLFAGPPATETLTMTADTLSAISNGQYSFNNLVSSTYKKCSVGPFFPPTPISSSYKPNQAPYVIDLDIEHTSGVGTRTITVKDLIIQWVDDDVNPKGKLTIYGGSIVDPLVELNGKTLLYFYNGGTPPIPIPGFIVPDVNTDCQINAFKPNHDILSIMGLTTFDCNPDLINDKLAFYNSIDTTNLDDLVFPDLGKAMDDYSNAISELRSKINEDSIDKFRDRMNEIMEDLKDQTESTYSQTLQSMISPLHSTATLDPEIQFISGKIKVSAALRNSTGQPFKDIIGEVEVPQKAIDDLLQKLKGEVSLGGLGSFTYDQTTGNFVSQISSSAEGDGILKLFYDGQQFGQVVIPENLNKNSEIKEIEFPYTFISGETETEGTVRRDETDAANN